MRITWYGHAAFLIETRGIRIVLDPYRSPDCGKIRCAGGMTHPGRGTSGPVRGASQEDLCDPHRMHPVREGCRVIAIGTSDGGATWSS